MRTSETSPEGGRLKTPLAMSLGQLGRDSKPRQASTALSLAHSALALGTRGMKRPPRHWTTAPRRKFPLQRRKPARLIRPARPPTARGPTTQANQPPKACPNPQCATQEPEPVQVAGPCGGANCATPPEPTQVACPSMNCATPEPQPEPTQVASYACATPEPAPVQVACPSMGCATPEGDHPARAVASLSPGGAALSKGYGR
jgi:hypothetical protein